MRHDIIDDPRHNGSYVPTGRHHLILWDNVQEQMEQVIRAEPKYIQFPTSESFEGRRLRSWSELREAANTPWERGLKVIEGMLEKLKEIKLPEPRSIRRRPVWSDEDGDDFDLDRFRRGQEFWRTTRRRPAGGPQIITLLVHIGGNANLAPEILMWRGATAIALASILETQGYRAEIMAYDYGYRVFKSGHGETQAVWVKRSHEHLDVATLVNTIAGWYFRTVFFGGYVLCPKQTPTAGLGCERTLPDWIRPHFGHDEAWIVQGTYSLETSVALASKLLQKLTNAPEVLVPTSGGYSTW